MRRVLYIAIPIVLVVVVVIGLTQAGGGSNLGDGTDFDLPAAKQELATAPPPLNGLYAQANTLIGGGESAFDQRIAELKGTPVIVNKWASWCGPCQAEFPVFQEAARTHGKEIAFVGLNAHDSDTAAKKFLDTRPLPFPSYTDPKDQIARKQEIAVGFPMTQFIDRDGKTAYIHTGPYTSEDQLTQDIERYLGA
jgi:thiol-disulfide isomerase/thioredoxin